MKSSLLPLRPSVLIRDPFDLIIGLILTILGSLGEFSSSLLNSKGSELNHSQALDGERRESKLFSCKSFSSAVSLFSSTSILTNKLDNRSFDIVSLNVVNIGFFTLGFVIIPLGDLLLCLISFSTPSTGRFNDLVVSPNLEGDRHVSQTVGTTWLDISKAVLVISTVVGGRLILVPSIGGGEGGGERHCSHREVDAVI